jgi:antitoxin component YwqK of YwqJK toxin-antitoxin module
MHTRLFSFILFLFSQIIYSQYSKSVNLFQPKYGVKFETSINRQVNNINLYEYDDIIDVFIEDFEFFKYSFYQGILVPDDLKIQLDSFFKNLKNNTIRNFDFELNEEGVLGVSKSIFDDSKITLSINPYLWKTSSTPKKLYVIYHELGHDILNLRHGEGGKMMFTLSDDEYTLKQFYEDRGYMFMNFFKRFFNDLGYKEFILNEKSYNSYERDYVSLQTISIYPPRMYLFGKLFTGLGVHENIPDKYSYWGENFKGKVRYFDNGIWRNNEYFMYDLGVLRQKAKINLKNLEVKNITLFNKETDFGPYSLPKKAHFVDKVTYYNWDAIMYKIDNVKDGSITNYNLKGDIVKVEKYIIEQLSAFDLRTPKRIKNGEQTLYYDNGTIEAIGLYENDKLLEYSWYDVDGKEEEKVTDVDENSQLDWERGFERTKSEKEYVEYPKIYRIKYYNKKGKIYRLQSIKNKKTHGDYIEYYESGKIKSKIKYVDGKEQGDYILYYESGEIRRIITKYVDGKEQGDDIWYNESGKINRKSKYVDGKRQGEEIGYYESGSVKYKENYVDGKRQGEEIGYYESGSVKYKENYVDDKEQGKRIVYYESGNIEHKENYVDGLIQGEGIWYYESGSVQSNLNYLDGKLQGEQIMYYESGSVNFKTNYVDDKEQGDRIDYYESGKIKSKSKYVDGKRQGDIIEYYESGELINNN